MNMWNHRKLAVASDLEATPPAVSEREAQDWSNFVVLVPDWSPPDTEMVTLTLRREAPPGRPGDETVGRSPWSTSNPSAVRFEVAGANRRLRVKQFLYDWAFPALDHPALWESKTVPEELTGRWRGHVVWHGIDYAGRSGASARLRRTLVELSVLDGEFTRDEIAGLYGGLRVVDENAASLVARTPFAHLGYWARYDTPAVGVPLGLWRIRQPGEVSLAWRSAANDPPGRSMPDRIGGLALDSWATERGNNDVRQEYVYLGGPHRNHELRVQLYGSATHPPMPESHPHHDATIRLGGREVALAWIDEDVGPFDALVAPRPDRTEGAFRVLCGSGLGCTRDWFTGAVAKVAASVDAAISTGATS